MSAVLEPQQELEPVEGWRAWELRREGGALRLISPIVEVEWPAGDRLAAACRRHGGHRAPAEDCSCGIYAVATSEALGTVRTGVGVVGSVAMWGRVVEHARGYRGEFAYPQRLRLVCVACLQNAGTFTAPSSVLIDDERLRPLCGYHVWTASSPSEASRVVPAADIEGELLSRYHIEVLPAESVPRRAARETRIRRRRRFRLDPTGELSAVLRTILLCVLVIAIVGGAARSTSVSRPSPSGGPASGPTAASATPSPGLHPQRRIPSKPNSVRVPPRLDILCGRGTRNAILVSDCRAPGVAWMSVETFRAGMRPHCGGSAFAQALPDGRARCWFRLDAS